MRQLSQILALALAATACSATVASARLKASDAAATHAYLKAVLASRRGGPTDQSKLKAIAALESQVKAECPGVLSGAPPHTEGEKTSESEQEISHELLIVTFGVVERLEHPADARFARTVRHLHWSNPRLTRLLRSLALEQSEQSGVPLPNLCSDAKFWVASGYTAVSAETTLFLHRRSVASSITQIEFEPSEPVGNLFNLTALVAHRLGPYENRADRLLAKRALPPTPKSPNHALTTFFEATDKVYAALGRPKPVT